MNLVEASDRRVVRCCVQAFGRLPGFLGYGLHGVDKVVQRLLALGFRRFIRASDTISGK